MNNTLENKKKSLEYLYDELTNAERDEFEERLFVDEDFGFFVENVESDLIDEYIRGELEFEEKRKFESKYLTSESRYEKIEIARTLQDELFAKEAKPITSISEDKSIWLSIAGFFRMPNLAVAGGLAVLFLMILLGGLWMFNKPDQSPNVVRDNNSNQEENLPQKELIPINENAPKTKETPTEDDDIDKKDSTESDKTESDTSPNPLPKTKNDSSNKTEKKTDQKPVEKKPKIEKKPQTVIRKSTIFIASLLPPLRSSQTSILKIPVSTKTVRLQLFDNFGQGYEKFMVELNDGIGNSIWGQEIKATKKGSQKSIIINVPNTKFKSGNYEIAVSGVTKDGEVEEINFYNFVVEKGKDKQE